jgi:hypothetical protein
MRNKLFAGVITLLISVAGRFDGHAVVVLPPQKVTLTWEYPISSPDIVFNVYHTTDLAAGAKGWTFLTNVTAKSCTLPVLPGNHFFTVTASNRITRLESLR